MSNKIEFGDSKVNVNEFDNGHLLRTKDDLYILACQYADVKPWRAISLVDGATWNGSQPSAADAVSNMEIIEVYQDAVITVKHSK